MNPLPSKQELLDFQARWMRPAGICAILGALLVAASLPLQPSVGGDNDAERLTKFHDQTTELIVGQGILIGLAVLLFVPVLYVLIRSAAGRTERVRRPMVLLAFIGPILFSASGLLVAIGLNDVADKFVAQAPAKERQAREAAAAAPKGTTTTQPSKPSGTTTTPRSTTTPQSTTTTPQSTTTTPRTPEQAAGKARDDLASNLLDDSTVLQVGSLVRFVGLLSLVFALIYIPLWSMRTGLLTRFWAMLGLALGVSLLLVPVGIFGLVLWFAVIGLMLAGWWPGPCPRRGTRARRSRGRAARTSARLRRKAPGRGRSRAVAGRCRNKRCRRTATARLPPSRARLRASGAGSASGGTRSGL